MDDCGYYQNSECRICKSGDLDKVLNMPANPFGDEYIPGDRLCQPQNEYPLDLYCCKSCGLLQIIDIVNPANLYLDYLYESKTSLELKKHFDQYAENIQKKWGLSKGALVVEIGCNDGMLLRALKNSGLKVIGVDPAKRFIEEYKKDGLELISGFFNRDVAKEIIEKHGKVKLIIANNVLANIDDLPEIMEVMELMLDGNGLFIMESGWSLPLIRDFVIDNIHHEHHSYFGVKPYSKLLANHGMELIDVEYVSTKGGSLRYSAQKSGGQYCRKNTVDKYCAEEEAGGIYDVESYRKFSGHLGDLKKSVKQYLEGCRDRGLKVAGYGASVGTTTLMCFFELQELIPVLYDDNEIKFDLYSPVAHIPVKCSGQIKEDQPDVIFIFCWRYAQPVIERHRDFLAAGGKFILPLPELKIIDSSVLVETV